MSVCTMMRAMGWVASLVGLMLAAGCERPPPQQPLRPSLTFPSPSRIERLAATEVDARDSEPVAVVDVWEGKHLPTLGEAAPDAAQLAWVDALTRAVGSRGATSRALHCFAEQAGQFFFERGAAPDGRLTRYMASRCGVYAPAVRFTKVIEEVPASISDQAIFDAWHSRLEAAVGAAIAKAQPGTHLGVWFGRDEHRAGIIVATARYEVELLPVTLTPQGNVHIAGRVTQGRPMHVDGLINSGTSGVRRCTRDERVALPGFAMACPLAPADAEAWLELQVYSENRLLGHTLARVLVHRGAEPAAFHGPRAEPAVVSTPGEFARVALDQLNAVRKGGNLEPLVLAEKQSALSTKVVARMLAAAEDDPKTADVIALGLMAGWRVPGVIRNASIVSNTMRATHDASAWVASALESPVSRAVLLDPDARQLALGATIDRPYQGLGVVATTYALFGSTDDARDRLRFVQALARRRAELGRRAPTVLDDPALLEDVALIHTGKHPMDIVGEAMERASMLYRSNVQGAFFTGNSIEGDLFPKELLEPQELLLSLAVTHVKLPDAAWGQYVVLVVVVDRPSVQPSEHTVPTRLEARRY